MTGYSWMACWSWMKTEFSEAFLNKENVFLKEQKTLTRMSPSSLTCIELKTLLKTLFIAKPSRRMTPSWRFWLISSSSADAFSKSTSRGSSHSTIICVWARDGEKTGVASSFSKHLSVSHLLDDVAQVLGFKHRPVERGSWNVRGPTVWLRVKGSEGVA